MNFLSRVLLLAVCLVATLGLASRADARTLYLSLLALLGVHLAVQRSLRALAARFWPITLFSAGTYVLQALTGVDSDPKLILKILFVFAAIRLLGCCSLHELAIPRDRHLYRLFLFAHFTRHFAAILAEETRRTLTARKIAAPRLYTRSGLSSLVHSLAAILQRTFVRAERFYAAQWLRGVGA